MAPRKNDWLHAASIVRVQITLAYEEAEKRVTISLNRSSLCLFFIIKVIVNVYSFIFA